MRTLIVVISVLLTTPVCAIAQQWQPVEKWPPLVQQDYSGANVAKPQVDPTAEQKRPDNVPLLLNTQPQATGSQTSSDQIRKDIDYQRESNEIQRQMTSLTRWLVLLGAGQAVIIFLQFLYGARAANAAKASAEVAKDALVKTQRARLFVSQWRLGFFEDAKPHEWSTVKFTIGNVGHVPAHLKSRRVIAMVAEELPKEPNYKTFKEKVFSHTLQPGGLINDEALVLEPVPHMVINVEKHEGVQSGKSVLYCCGSITYIDDFGGPYEVGFLAAYDPARKEFSVIAGREGFNYST